MDISFSPYGYLLEGYFYVDDKMSIKEIVDKWIKDGDKGYDPKDRHHGYWPIKEVDKYKEYDWSKTHKRQSDDEWEELKESMKKNGWDKNRPAIIKIDKSTKRVWLGEGNHRLAVAKELGIKEVPVVFVFTW